MTVANHWQSGCWQPDEVMLPGELRNNHNMYILVKREEYILSKCINTQLEVFMHRILIVLTLLLILLVSPSLGVLADAPQSGHITDCRYSYPTAFGTGGATEGQISQRFSTLRAAPGDYSSTIIFSPATFTVLDQGCFGGFSWVQIEYTSGIVCEYPAHYYHHPYLSDSYCTGDATGRVGWALESQLYYDGWFGPGHWLIP